MKTQLLEDIGQSAQLSLTPSKIVGNSKAGKEPQYLAPAGNAQVARSPAARGVWRQKSAGEPQPDQQTTPLDIQSVFEEIAALEAQYVPPGQQHEPVMAPLAPRHELAALPAAPLHTPAISAAEPTLAMDTAHTAPAPDPLFDFTPAAPAPQAANPFTPAPRPSRGRYFLWAACLLSAALLILGGRWFYQQRSDAGSPAPIAKVAKETPQVDSVAKAPAIAAKESAPAPDAGARATPAVPASRPVPAVPPLVMLEPAPSAAVKPEQARPSMAGRAEIQTPPTPEPAGEQGPVSPLPKPSHRRVREQGHAAAEPATKRREREPVRHLARTSAIEAERSSSPETAMEATLRACREHGYHAAQCIKRACSLTAYGFVCRGR